MNRVVDFLKETKTVVIGFIFKPKIRKEKILQIPRNLMKISVLSGILGVGVSIVTMLVAFFLKGSYVLIEHKFILLGIILFMLYEGSDIIIATISLLSSSMRSEFDLIFQDEIVLAGSKIMTKVSGKVLKYDEEKNIYTNLSNENILNCIRNYLRNAWNVSIDYYFNIVDTLSIFVMLVAAVVTNTAVKQLLFIPMIISFGLVSLITSVYKTRSRRIYIRENRKFDNHQSEIANDLLRVEPIILRDLDMRISKFQKLVGLSNQNTRLYHKRIRWYNLMISSIEVALKYIFIIVYICNVSWVDINIATIAEIIATLAIVETVLNQISQIGFKINMQSEILVDLKSEQEDMSLIMDVYNNKIENVNNEINNLYIKPFSIKYKEVSENDIAFNLISNKEITIPKGSVNILYGPSGTGKSTFMKVLTQRIVLDKTSQLPSTNRFMFYDENLRFGSMNIYDELFCCEEPNKEKMKEILIHLNLWNEIEANCKNVWQWMKEKKFDSSLSNGQKQRLILSKMLYWIDEDIDMIVLDEATSGLDEEGIQLDAQKVLEYITKYVNKDKKRIVIIATHQNIDAYKKSISNTIQEFYFEKKGDKSFINKVE